MMMGAEKKLYEDEGVRSVEREKYPEQRKENKKKITDNKLL